MNGTLDTGGMWFAAVALLAVLAAVIIVYRTADSLRVLIAPFLTC